MARQAVEMTFPDDLPPAAPGNKAGVPAMPVIQARSLSVLARARGLVITNQDELSAADQFRQDIKALLRSIDEAFDPGSFGLQSFARFVVIRRNRWKKLPWRLFWEKANIEK